MSVAVVFNDFTHQSLITALGVTICGKKYFCAARELSGELHEVDKLPHASISLGSLDFLIYTADRHST